MLIPNLTAAAVFTVLQPNGVNGNGNVLDLQQYKGPVTFLRVVGVAPAAGNVEPYTIQTSSDNSNWSNVSGGTFTNVANAANASNTGTASITYDTRALSRYVRAPGNTSAANIPLSIVAIGQLERV